MPGRDTWVSGTSPGICRASLHRIDPAAIRMQADESSCGLYRSPPIYRRAGALSVIEKRVTPAELKKSRKRVPLWHDKNPPVFPSRS